MHAVTRTLQAASRGRLVTISSSFPSPLRSFPRLVVASGLCDAVLGGSRLFATKPAGATGVLPPGPPARLEPAVDTSGPMIVEVTKENFDAEVNKSTRPVILDVYADW